MKNYTYLKRLGKIRLHHKLTVILIYKDYIEVMFNVVFSFVDDEITHDLHITIER